MIIGFDSSRAFLPKRSGTEEYSYQLLKALSKIDHKNEYIVYLRDARYEIRDKKWPENFKFTVIKWLRLWTQGGLALQTFKDDLDVLFVPAHTLPIIRKRGLKTVMTVHDLGVEYLPQFHQLKQQLYLKYITRYQLRSATKIIAVSKATKEDLIKRAGIDPKKISVVYEGYDKEKFKADRLVSTLNHYDLVSGEYFLFVGTVQPRKNLERLIKAFRKELEDRRLMTDDLRLVIVGPRGWLSDDIYKLPKKLGIEKRVKFLGYVPDEDMPIFYSGAIALLFPSLFEGFGLPILEAQACGCPVLTSNISSMPEVAGRGAIYVNPNSVDDIVEGMECVMDQVSRVKLIKAGFENVKRFSWEKCARETLRVLEQVTSNK